MLIIFKQPIISKQISSFSNFNIYLIPLLVLSVLLSACGSPKITQQDLHVQITVDGTKKETNLSSGSTVQNALDSLGIEIGSLDKVEPPLYSIITDMLQINVIRIKEEFTTEQVIVPYFQQVLKSESIPPGEQRIIQQGENGLKEITYRIIYENGEQTSKSPINEPVIQPAIPEIVMVGVQMLFSPIPIPGKLAYFSTGNAWIMDGSTANRRLLVTTGDLDGRIFSLSPDADWLLFTRKSTKPVDQEINTLWVVSTQFEKPTMINLKVSNIIHFAGWIPNQPGTIAYSTVEPRNSSPAWQANNDLYSLTFSSTGWTSKPKLLLDSNAGGTYGWWGTYFTWSSDGIYLAYARPDEIGLVDLEKKDLKPLYKLTPFLTHQDWAWIPQIAWGADNLTLLVTDHGPSENQASGEDSQLFDLTALSLKNGLNIQLVQQTGMYTSPSSSYNLGETGKIDYQIAFLQAIFPDQSLTSRYRLVVMDRDGSNHQIKFPPDGYTGIAPQVKPQVIELQLPVWAPRNESIRSVYIAVLYQGDIWLVDTQSDFSQQITGDGLIERMDWK
jgi:hypothetical protein